MSINIYDELRVAGCRLGNHESDLYVLADGNSRPIIRAAVLDKRLSHYPTLFRSDHPDDKGALWYEIPFAFAPFWRTKR